MSAGSAHERIAARIRARIESGELKPGDRAPSIRALVQSSGLSKITVERAYEKLRQEGLVFGIAKSGYFVADWQTARDLDEFRPRLDEMEGRLRRLEEQVRKLRNGDGVG